MRFAVEKGATAAEKSTGGDADLVQTAFFIKTSFRVKLVCKLITIAAEC
jgi:hypothetical protein